MASQGRTLLGQKYEEQVRDKYCIRFTVEEDGFYESPWGENPACWIFADRHVS